jgi:hypothetical protein
MLKLPDQVLFIDRCFRHLSFFDAYKQVNDVFAFEELSFRTKELIH